MIDSDSAHTGSVLPVRGRPTPERRDAARSRRRIVDAARKLLRERGAEEVTMNEVAAAAGVGVGTVYRRFGDVAQLLHAVLDDEERALQERMLSGQPPFDPGAPTATRVTAFLHAYIDYLEANAELLYAADTATPGARFRVGAYANYRHHLATLLAAADIAVDPAYAADLLLAAIDAELYVTQRHELGMSVERIKSGLGAVVRSLLATRSANPDDR
ncbi:MAG TPA: helix-turn-helix domain-containing protein [Solirubrobacterales bacterium]|nr:helix-turn-helix domain-containing protein [Solirubrobacterales bacterium]